MAAVAGNCTGGYFCVSGSVNGFGGTGTSGGTTEAPCPAGHVCEPGSVAPQPCAAGRHAPSSRSAAATDCVLCDEGSHCNATGLARPSGLCAPGYFCLRGVDTATPTNGIVNTSVALAGGGGTVYLLVGGDVCPPGYLCIAGTAVPVQCPSGRYNALPGVSTTCAECPQGFFCEAASSSFNAYVRCLFAIARHGVRVAVACCHLFLLLLLSSLTLVFVTPCLCACIEIYIGRGRSWTSRCLLTPASAHVAACVAMSPQKRLSPGLLLPERHGPRRAVPVPARHLQQQQRFDDGGGVSIMSTGHVLQRLREREPGRTVCAGLLLHAQRDGAQPRGQRDGRRVSPGVLLSDRVVAHAAVPRRPRVRQQLRRADGRVSRGVLLHWRGVDTDARGRVRALRRVGERVSVRPLLRCSVVDADRVPQRQVREHDGWREYC
jgi:hypothetical protein